MRRGKDRPFQPRQWVDLDSWGCGHYVALQGLGKTFHCFQKHSIYRIQMVKARKTAATTQGILEGTTENPVTGSVSERCFLSRVLFLFDCAPQINGCEAKRKEE